MLLYTTINSRKRLINHSLVAPQRMRNEKKTRQVWAFPQLGHEGLWGTLLPSPKADKAGSRWCLQGGAVGSPVPRLLFTSPLCESKSELQPCSPAWSILRTSPDEPGSQERRCDQWPSRFSGHAAAFRPHLAQEALGCPRSWARKQLPCGVETQGFQVRLPLGPAQGTPAKPNGQPLSLGAPRGHLSTSPCGLAAPQGPSGSCPALLSPPPSETLKDHPLPVPPSDSQAPRNFCPSHGFCPEP